MKKILITGANSFIGQSFEEYMQQYKDAYQVQTLDMIGDGWREKELSGYDVIFHVAGIVHQKESDENRDLYYKVNRDLVAELAQKAKMAGVSQFVFMSTMSVYGMESGVITPDTKPVPVSHYGKSKLAGEELFFEYGAKTLSDLFSYGGFGVTGCVCMLIFALFHAPCSTSVITVYKETRSIKYTALSVLIPTLIGFLLCVSVNLLMSLFGL